MWDLGIGLVVGKGWMGDSWLWVRWLLDWLLDLQRDYVSGGCPRILDPLTVALGAPVPIS